MLESFREGGWAMMPTALLGTLLFAVALRYATKPEARWVPLQVSLALATLATGSLGFVAGLVKSATALGGVPPGRAGRIFAIGFGESLQNVGLALTLLALSALVVSFGAARAALQPTS